MTYLSRLLLNPRSRGVRRDLADCQAMHRTVLSAFPDQPDGVQARAGLGVLYRVETDPHARQTLVLVQSHGEPDWRQLETGYLLLANGEMDNPACKAVSIQYAVIAAGVHLRFRLQANPTRKIDTKSGADGLKRNGRRVDLHREDEQLTWLARKGEQHGFGVLSVRTRTERSVGLRSGGRLTFGGVVFDGLLVVRDADSFKAALADGIGSAKAFGFGLLSIARAPQMEE